MHFNLLDELYIILQPIVINFFEIIWEFLCMKSSKIEIFSKKGLFFKPFYDTILSVRKIEQNQLKSKVYIFQIFTRENGHWLETIKYRI